MKKRLSIAGVILALAFIGTGATAQEESTNRVFSETDWSVFVEDNPKQCWIVSSAKGSVNTRNGRVVAVTRGDTLMFVSFWPNSNKRGEVSFTGGYPYASGSTVTLEIGTDKFDLFTSGETAWAASPEEDRKIIASMRRGAEAVVTGLSSRNTQTKDTISLRGFTRAYEDAEKRCN